MLALAAILLLLGSCSLEEPMPYLPIGSVYHLDYTWMVGSPDEQKVVVEATWHDESFLAEFGEAPNRVDASYFRIPVNGVPVAAPILVSLQTDVGFTGNDNDYLRIEPELKVGDILLVRLEKGRTRDSWDQDPTSSPP